jgi:hypothetical protein
MKFSAEQHRQMSHRLYRRLAQTRKAARRRELLKLARAFLALAKLAEAAHGRPIAAANGHHSSALRPMARRTLNS